MKKNNDGGKKLALGALIGVVAGFLTGILTAPKSGKETREDIKKTANKAKIEAEKKLKNLHKEIAVLLDKATNLANSSSSKIKKELDKAVANAKETQQKIKEVISAIKNGETDEPELKKAVAEATKAKDHLAKFFKQDR